MTAMPSLLPIDVEDDYKLYNHVTGNPYAVCHDPGWKQADDDAVRLGDLSQSTFSVDDLTRHLGDSTLGIHDLSTQNDTGVKRRTRSCCKRCVALIQEVALHLSLAILLRLRYLFPYTFLVVLLYLALIHVTLFVVGAYIRHNTEEIYLSLDHIGEADVFYQTSHNSSQVSGLVKSYLDDVFRFTGAWVHLIKEQAFGTNYHSSCNVLHIGTHFKVFDHIGNQSASLRWIQAKAYYYSSNHLGQMISVEATMKAIQSYLRQTAPQPAKKSFDLSIGIVPVPLTMCARAKFFFEHYNYPGLVVAAMTGYASMCILAVSAFDLIDARASGFDRKLAKMKDGSLLALGISYVVNVCLYPLMVVLAWSLQLVFHHGVSLPLTVALVTYSIPGLILVHLMQKVFKRKLRYFSCVLFVEGPLAVVFFVSVHLNSVRQHNADSLFRILIPVYNTMVGVRHQLMTQEWGQFCGTMTFGMKCDLPSVLRECPDLCTIPNVYCFWKGKIDDIFIGEVHMCQSLVLIFLCVFLKKGGCSSSCVKSESKPSQSSSVRSTSTSSSAPRQGPSNITGMTIRSRLASVDLDGQYTDIGNLNLRLSPGECLTILGKERSGNRVMLQVMAGILPPTKGTMSVVESEWETLDPSPNQPVRGYCPGKNQLHPYLTGREIMNYVICLYDVQTTDDRNRMAAIMSDLQLGDEVDELVVDMREDTKKLVQVACVLLLSPKILFLDHPTENLDWLQKILVWNRLHHLKVKGHIMILTSDSGEECSTVGTSFLVMENGKVALQTTIHKVGSYVSGVHAYVWLAHDEEGNELGLVPVIKEIQRNFHRGTYAYVNDARERYAVFPFINIAQERELAMIYEILEECKERSMLQRFSVQTTSTKNVLEAFQEHWLQY